jgi:hypothetical protein
MRRSRRPATTAEVDPKHEVVDLRERLAPYGHADLRPGWREQLIAEDAKRRQRRQKVDAWGFRG